MATKEEIIKVAHEHWNWIEGLAELFLDVDEKEMKIREYLYKTAFMHGYKHGVQSVKDDDGEI